MRDQDYAVTIQCLVSEGLIVAMKGARVEDVLTGVQDRDTLLALDLDAPGVTNAQLTQYVLLHLWNNLLDDKLEPVPCN